MHRIIGIICLLAAFAFPQAGLAQPDKDSLIEAWEAYVASLPGTAWFESVGDGTYRLRDDDLPYDGELTVVGVLVRNAESAGIDTGFTHIGMVEFELADLPVERLSSQSYYYWLSDRQTLHYAAAEGRWVDPTTYSQAITNLYSGGTSYRPMSFMLNYGIWLLLLPLIALLFVVVSRQSRKGRALLDDSAAINRRARENLERSKSMQDEVLAIAREARDLQADNNAILRQILDTLKD